MEAFAKTANAVRREHGIRLRLPAFPLETPITDVLACFAAEIEKAQPQAIEGAGAASGGTGGRS